MLHQALTGVEPALLAIGALIGVGAEEVALRLQGQVQRAAGGRRMRR